MRPSCITATWSAISRTTSKSCVMNSTALECLASNWRNSLSTCTWVVTSSAVVGSSAMISAGSSASAIAIMMRWRCPPDN
ncbi:Uncharacterised protein [Bordetella pertussis]|nr:Uncharacterised protein [Bordetella pertussis]